MIVIYLALGILLYKEIVGYLICGWYLTDMNIVEELLEHKSHINLQLSEDMIFVDVDKAYFTKAVDEWFWKWYMSDGNGKRRRIFRWSKISKHLDNTYLELKNK